MTFSNDPTNCQTRSQTGRLRHHLVPLLFVFAALSLASGCAPDITDTEFFSRHPGPEIDGDGTIVLLDHSEGASRITLSHDGPLRWGYNEITAEIEGSVSNVSTVLYLDTGSQRIESPIGPMHILDPELDGDWMIEVSFSTPAGQFIARNAIEVTEDIWVQRLEGSDLFVSWIAPGQPSTGAEMFEVAVHTFNGSAFEPSTGLNLDLYPYMDMGGGDGHSTPYSKPVHTGNGFYQSEVNFIMSGGWDMTVLFSDTESVVFKGFTVK